MAENDGFDGTYIAHGATTINGKLRNVQYSRSVNPVDVTGSTSTRHEFEAGITSHTVSFEEIGITSLTPGTKAQFVITWLDADSSTVTLTYMMVSSIDCSGDIDGAIMSSVELVPSTAL